MSIKYMSPELVSETKIKNAPRSGFTQSGYGGRIPTDYMVKYAGRWRRVYAMVYGNSGSTYINVQGETLHTDIDTEYRLMESRVN